jgi:hypothetical protein
LQERAIAEQSRFCVRGVHDRHECWAESQWTSAEAPIVLLPRLLLAFEDIEQNILVETNGLTSSLSFLLCHPNAEAAQLVIVDELDSGVFECRLNFDQS